MPPVPFSTGGNLFLPERNFYQIHVEKTMHTMKSRSDKLDILSTMKIVTVVSSHREIRFLIGRKNLLLRKQMEKLPKKEINPAG
ncbi:hypothetical protein JW979_06665 [bacterium]|nr:hypothetical protein [candidate division CSSED10-310 bacterium]